MRISWWLCSILSCFKSFSLRGEVCLWKCFWLHIQSLQQIQNCADFTFLVAVLGKFCAFNNISTSSKFSNLLAWICLCYPLYTFRNFIFRAVLGSLQNWEEDTKISCILPAFCLHTHNLPHYQQPSPTTRVVHLL